MVSGVTETVRVKHTVQTGTCCADIKRDRDPLESDLSHWRGRGGAAADHCATRRWLLQFLRQAGPEFGGDREGLKAITSAIAALDTRVAVLTQRLKAIPPERQGIR